MAKNYYFGKAFTYEFAVWSNELGEYESLSGVTDSPTVYVYNFKPTREQAINGTGSPLETITSWADNPDTKGKDITIPSLTDPQPNSERQTFDYWLAVNYVRVDSGDSILELRKLPIERPIATGEPLKVTSADLSEVFADVSKYATAAEQLSKIDLAKKMVAANLNKGGYEWASLYEPNDLNLVVVYQALAMLMLESQFAGNSEFIARREAYQENVDTLMKSLNVRFDEDKSGEPDNATPVSGVLYSSGVTFLR